MHTNRLLGYCSQKSPHPHHARKKPHFFLSLHGGTRFFICGLRSELADAGLLHRHSTLCQLIIEIRNFFCVELIPCPFMMTLKGYVACTYTYHCLLLLFASSPAMTPTLLWNWWTGALLQRHWLHSTNGWCLER